MKLIIGLGNPGVQYEHTRHNFGRLLINRLAKRYDAKLGKHKTNATVDTITVHEERVILAAPLCFMNESGMVVNSLKTFFKVANEDIIICYDDIDIPFGSIRIGENTSSGGHNGIQSVIDHLKSTAFKRVRLGIGPQIGLSEDYVLSPWSTEQKKTLPHVLDSAAAALDGLLARGHTEGTATIDTKNPFG